MRQARGASATTLLRWVLAVATTLAALSLGARHITTATIGSDGTQSAVMAINLAHQGTISLSDTPPYPPSNYREPIPVILTALDVRLMDAVLGVAPTDDYFAGERVRLLKYPNLLWLLLLLVGIFACIHVATGSYYFSLAGAAIGGIQYGASALRAPMLNDLSTDLAGAAVLAVASAALAAGLTRQSPRLSVLAGALFGAMALVKAGVLYIFIGVIGTLLCACLLWRTRIVLRSALRDLVLVMLAFIVVVAPWMLRNRIELGTFQIAQRAGVVLLARAVQNEMSPEEYRGAFYVWAPPSIQGAIGSLLGFTPRDLQRGGRLQRMNRSETSDFYASDVAAEQAGRPAEAISYYRRARAERVKLIGELEAAGAATPDVEADDILQRRAMSMIEAHPGKHLAATIPLLWRGAPVAFPLLVIAVALAIRYRHYECALLALPSFGVVMFYALLSHFLPRYAEPVRPVVIALIVIAAKLGLDGLRKRSAPAVTTAPNA